MIGIKMDLPKSCKECDLNCTLYRTFNEEEYEIKRHPNCPLVDLGKEDMSWEELVEKVKELSGSQINDNNFALRNYNIVFFKNGKIGSYYDNGYITFINDERILKFFEMYQIIKSLVGDER